MAVFGYVKILGEWTDLNCGALKFLWNPWSSHADFLRSFPYAWILGLHLSSSAADIMLPLEWSTRLSKDGWEEVAASFRSPTLLDLPSNYAFVSLWNICTYDILL